MRATLHPCLLNGRTGDPGLWLEALHQSEAVLLDCGDLSGLAPRQLLRTGLLGVSHAHMDHWAGFDRLLRLLIGRERVVQVVGPAGFAARLWHRLQAYTWNLVDRIAPVLAFEVTEVTEGPLWPRRRFRLQTGFRPEALPPQPAAADGTVLTLGALRLQAAVLDHGTPCLGFAVSEAMRINVWRTRLEARGLPVGPWLTRLKQAVREGAPDATPIAVAAPRGGPGEGRGEGPGEEPAATTLPLGALRDLVEVTPGQRLAYLTDFADTPANRAAAIALAQGADILFIEAPFAAADAAHARDRRHLTTQAAGEIARAAGAGRIEPFHLSPRYEEGEARLLAEVAAAAGRPLA
ncbi:MBL fold metallo-hydrolase [Roseicella frigidaeris]|uniref:Ribonuclease Z n=1 Tax=Roseicella frigidaeris TaxID=2230885 RepID=A0A327M0C7_9PROT|nr:MBL fold metallo-hydrolase [Roseicella frigidaeris]RAI55996.1 ribonuclease Z [Roseicella frigidaeris]